MSEQLRGPYSYASPAALRTNWEFRREFATGFLSQIDAPFLALTDRSDWPNLSDFNELLQSRGADGLYPQLVDQPKLGQRARARINQEIRSGRVSAADHRYEYFVAEKGVVPIKANNWHDFFNIYTWWKFPRAKREVFRLAYQEVCRFVAEYPRQVFATRTPLHDRLTAFEEGSVILFVKPEGHPEVCQAIVTGAGDFRAEVIPHLRHVAIYGHAIYEEVLYQKSGHFAFALAIPDEETGLTWDEKIARYLQGHGGIPDRGIGSLAIRDLMAFVADDGSGFWS